MTGRVFSCSFNLSPTEGAFNEAVEAFSRKKQTEREEAERREVSERQAREEPVKRAREIEDLRLRIDALPRQTAGPLREQLAKVPIDGKPREYRKAVHDVERAIAETEG